MTSWCPFCETLQYVGRTRSCDLTSGVIEARAFGGLVVAAILACNHQKTLVCSR